MGCNIKTDVKEVQSEGVDCIGLTELRTIGELL
jgi:hypothetical protein